MKRILVMTMLSSCMFMLAYDRHDSLFENMKAMKGAKVEKVEFTGGFPENPVAGLGFVMMRGNGNGLTAGEKIGLPGIDIVKADSIFDIFNSESTWGSSDNLKTCSDDRLRIAYSLYFNEKSDSLYMLRVKFEDEPSIPNDWPYRNHYNASDSVQVSYKLYEPTPKIDWTEALVRLYDEVRYNFVFYPQIESQWEKSYKYNLKAIKRAKDDFDALRILQRMVASCGDGHTYIDVLSNKIETPGLCPYATVMFPDGLYISSVESRELSELGMKRGQKILSVNGESPETWAERELKPYVCSSTPQWMINQMFDGYNFSRVRYGTQISLKLENSDGNIVEIEYRVGGPTWDRSLHINKNPDFKVIDDSIGLLTIPDFQNRRVTEFFDSVFPAIQSTKSLIIDIRGNGGGNSGYANQIIRYMIDKPILDDIWTTRVYKPAFASWGYDEETYKSPQDTIQPLSDITPYVNPIVLLTDRGTFSAAEDFTGVLKSAGRVTQIGTATGGSTGNGVRPYLTSDKLIMANICSKHDVTPNGTEFVGIGLIPDIVVEETSASYFEDGRDDVIDMAIQFLKSKY